MSWWESAECFEDPLPKKDIDEVLDRLGNEATIGQRWRDLEYLFNSVSFDTVLPFNWPVIQMLWLCCYKSEDAERSGKLSERLRAELVTALSTPGQERRDPKVTAAIVIATEKCILADGIFLVMERPWE
jgi:hypothetical protein